MSSKAVAEAKPPGSCGTDAVFNGAVAPRAARPAFAADDRSLDRECERLTNNVSDSTDEARPTDRSNGVVVTPPLPKGCVPLAHQVAGHMYGKGATKAGLLQDGMGTVLKPGQNSCRGKRERMFYQNVTRPDQLNPVYTGLRPLVPHFYGTFVSPEDPSLVYLKINDVTTRFRKPCVMDVKIGSKSYEDGVPLRKVQLAKMKYPNLEKIGFQILGMRVYHQATDEFECRDKFYGRSLQGDNVIEGFARYLNVVDGIRIDVLPEFLKQMRRIERWFAYQKQLHFYSSSLLFVYEGATMPTASPATATAPTEPENDVLSSSPPNFVSYSQLKRVGPKAKPSSTAAESLPQESNIFSNQGEHPLGENGFVNRLPTYQESIAAKLGHRGGTDPLEGGVSHGAEGVFSNGGETQPPLLDINGSLTVSQMRERQRSQSQSNEPSNSLPQPEPAEEEPMAEADSNAHQIQPVEAANVSTNQSEDEKESDSKLAIIKMIDFTHVVEADGNDESYLFGLRNVIRSLEMLNNVYAIKK